MASLVRRRFRPPVIGRLAWAWIFSAALLACLIGWAATRDDKDARVALALEGEIEQLAPPEPRTFSVLPQPAPGLREGAPRLEEPFFAAAEDRLAETAAEPLVQPAEEFAGEVVITIDGGPARSPDERPLSARPASYVARAIPAPDPALLQTGRFGQMPKIASDGRRASRYYARPLSRAAGTETRVGLIVAGLGLNAELTARAIDELPADITLAFAPYARDLERWTARARAAGHEIIVELPMEAHGASADALGPAALLTSRSAEENLQRLDWLLARFGGYFAATNYLGGKFSAEPESFSPILKRLAELGVGYVDDTGAVERADAPGADIAFVDRMIAPPDGADSARAVQRDLAALQSIAADRGAALGKVYAFPGVVEAVLDWTGELEEEAGAALVPASAVLHARARAR